MRRLSSDAERIAEQAQSQRDLNAISASLPHHLNAVSAPSPRHLRAISAPSLPHLNAISTSSPGPHDVHHTQPGRISSSSQARSCPSRACLNRMCTKRPAHVRRRTHTRTPTCTQIYTQRRNARNRQKSLSKCEHVAPKNSTGMAK
eukprot:3030835-Pleurochrysis_carterae.AAC.1